MTYIVMVLLMSVQILAADSLIAEEEIDVKAQYIEKDLENSTILGSGQSITLQDGTVITIKSNDEADDDIKAVIIPVTKEEEEAYHYVIDMTKEYGENPYAFYVLFYRNGEEVTPSKPVTVTVTIPDGYEKSSLYSFTGDGKSPEKLSEQSKDGVWTFDVADSRYFAMLLPKTEDNTTATDKPTDTSTNTSTGTNTSTSTNASTSTGTSTGTGTSTSTTARRVVTTNTTSTRTTSTTSTRSNTTTSKTSTTGNATSSTQKAKTGDETKIGFWLIVLVGSVVLMLLTVILYKRKKNI